MNRQDALEFTSGKRPLCHLPLGTLGIPLTQGQTALIYEFDYERIVAYDWYANWYDNAQTFYAQRWTKIAGKEAIELMHRLIMGAVPGQEVDHIDHNGLDNRRDKLRLATVRQNRQNREKRSKCSSRFKGVIRRSGVLPWEAAIRAGEILPCGKSRQLYLGRFATEEEAARAYDRMARKHFGEFARPNFPDESP